MSDETITCIMKLKHEGRNYLLIEARGEYVLWEELKNAHHLAPVDRSIAMDIIATELSTIVRNLNTQGDPNV